MQLSHDDQALLNGSEGAGAAMAMRILTDAARLLGAVRLIDISSAHIDGCLYHGDAGVVFAEKLVAGGAAVQVPATLNVGALDLLRPENVSLGAHASAMALRQMQAYRAMGCTPSWTCAPYQAGHRPAIGENVAWGESNAVAFVNSVLGARSNRYGDFLDICCAITGRAPETGLHLEANRRATVLVETDLLSDRLKHSDVLYPVLGTWYGRAVGAAVGVVAGLPGDLTEDRLKAFGAAAASSGAVGLFHVAGRTPEAPSVAAALAGQAPEQTIQVTPDMLRTARDGLSTTEPGQIHAVALGSPHFSIEEFRALAHLLAGRRSAVPFYVCTGRHTIDALEAEGLAAGMAAAGVTIIADTCVVVTPILAGLGGVLMTNSGKFAHYAPANTGYSVLYGSLEDCVESAVAGRAVRNEALWR